MASIVRLHLEGELPPHHARRLPLLSLLGRPLRLHQVEHLALVHLEDGQAHPLEHRLHQRRPQPALVLGTRAAALLRCPALLLLERRARPLRRRVRHNRLDEAWHHASRTALATRDCVGLARAGLPVRKHGHIVPCDELAGVWRDKLVVQLLLRALLSKDVVKGEGLHRPLPTW